MNLLNTLLRLLVLLLLISIESVLGLPIFSLLFFFKWLDKTSLADQQFYQLVLALLVMALILALFYQLGLAWSLILLMVYYSLRNIFGQQLFLQKPRVWQILQLLLFAILQAAILLLAHLRPNLFLLGQLLLALILFIKRNSTVGRL